ncbi:MAG TPA: hypothetical protein VNX15_00995 [Gemmatimonadales bacterium]|nr:hypothetical protein [Gemmatimonadales bacterium]
MIGAGAPGPVAAAVRGTGSGVVTARGTSATLTAYATAYAASRTNAKAIPAFARKYGLACSACHTAWPELNAFGQAFRDRGYQLGNERDSPIWQNASYFPVTARITPQWHRESANQQTVDVVPGDTTSGTTQRTLTMSGFGLSGMDLWMAGTLFKNISFVLLPSSDENAQWHFEAAFVRFDNLANSGWVNFKFGKFELDNLISEKRFLFLSGNGGSYLSYHFAPPGETSNDFGIGDNQIGAELSGHSDNSYTRYGLALLSSTDGNPDLAEGQSYDADLTLSQAWDAGKLGVQRLGAFAYLGQRPTYYQTSGGAPIAGTGTGAKGFYRVGLAGDFFLGNSLEFLPFVMHAHDNAFLGSNTPSNVALPAGAQAPEWNGAFLESHYYINPQLVLLGRYEAIRMSQQANAGMPSSLGNQDALSFGTRWYPIMFSRAGLAWDGEWSIVKTNTGGAPMWSNSVLIALDFDF